MFRALLSHSALATKVGGIWPFSRATRSPHHAPSDYAKNGLRPPRFNRARQDGSISTLPPDICGRRFQRCQPSQRVVLIAPDIAHTRQAHQASLCCRIAPFHRPRPPRLRLWGHLRFYKLSAAHAPREVELRKNLTKAPTNSRRGPFATEAPICPSPIRRSVGSDNTSEQCRPASR